MTSEHSVASGDNPAPPAPGVQTAQRTDVPAARDDRTQLTTMLDYARATVHAKCAGLSEEHARGPRFLPRRS